MRTSYNRRADKQKADRQGLVMLGVCVGVIGASVIAVAANRPAERDKLTGCLMAPAAVQRVIIGDRTEAWGKGDGVVLQEAMMSLLAKSQTDDRVTLLAFDGSEDGVEPLFDRCRPPEGKDVSAIVGNPKAADRVLAKEFVAPASAAIARLTTAGKAAETHVLGFLTKVVARLRYQGRSEAIVVDVFSDMGEATKEGSFLKKRKALDAASFKAYFDRLGGDRLKGITLRVHVLPTASTKGEVAARIKQAWLDALQSVGVSVTWEAL